MEVEAFLLGRGTVNFTTLFAALRRFCGQEGMNGQMIFGHAIFFVKIVSNR
jgi:hypothetical protein